MTSDPMWDVVHAAQHVRDEIAFASRAGGVTVQESVSMAKLDRALEAFLDEVGA